MPKGIPVATFAIGEAGAANAALHVIAQFSLDDELIRERLLRFRSEQTASASAMVLPPSDASHA
jgi:5-(carboxyamino)imidazole ribonucleotide mutase